MFKHSYDFAQVNVQLVERFSLRVRTWEARHKPDEKPCVRATLNDGEIASFHARRQHVVATTLLVRSSDLSRA